MATRELFDRVRQRAASDGHFEFYGGEHCRVIDAAAQHMAERCRDRLRRTIPLNLTKDEWVELTAILQSEMRVAIRYTAYPE